LDSVKRKYKLLHITHSFGYGGAEVLVKNLLLNHDKQRFDIAACSILKRKGTSIEKELDEKDITVFYLNKPLGPNLFAIIKLRKLFLKYKPDIIHTHCLGLSYALVPSILAKIPVKNTYNSQCH
jgi:glycosyltransferase involved in cell wall biosynthesis